MPACPNKRLAKGGKITEQVRERLKHKEKGAFLDI